MNRTVHVNKMSVFHPKTVHNDRQQLGQNRVRLIKNFICQAHEKKIMIK